MKLFKCLQSAIQCVPFTSYQNQNKTQQQLLKQQNELVRSTSGSYNDALLMFEIITFNACSSIIRFI